MQSNIDNVSQEVVNTDEKEIQLVNSSQVQSNEKPKKKKKKRTRGQKPKLLVVAGPGELPKEKKLRDGKVRHYDILKGNSAEDKLPRKTRDMLARIAMAKGANSRNLANAAGPALLHTKRNGATAEIEVQQVTKSNSRNKSVADEQKPVDQQTAMRSVSNSNSEGAVTQKGQVKKMFEGMRPGETYSQFVARLRQESKRMILSTARKGSHQREKKRAYYERRKERIERKKRRRRGEYSDSEVEEDDENYQEIAHFPAYWQEILQNNGRPMSAKRRKRLHRAQAEETEQVAFGEQVERPPKITTRPQVRGQK